MFSLHFHPPSWKGSQHITHGEFMTLKGPIPSRTSNFEVYELIIGREDILTERYMCG